MAMKQPSQQSGDGKKETVSFKYTPQANEIPYYESLFRHADKSDNGVEIAWRDAKQFLVLSGLPRTHIHNIWNMANIDGTNTLNRRKFNVAVRLVQLRQNNKMVNSMDLTVDHDVSLKPAFFKGISGTKVPFPPIVLKNTIPMSITVQKCDKMVSSMTLDDDELDNHGGKQLPRHSWHPSSIMKVDDEKENVDLLSKSNLCSSCCSCAEMRENQDRLQHQLVTVMETLEENFMKMDELQQEVTQLRLAAVRPVYSKDTTLGDGWDKAIRMPPVLKKSSTASTRSVSFGDSTSNEANSSSSGQGESHPLKNNNMVKNIIKPFQNIRQGGAVPDRQSSMMTRESYYSADTRLERLHLKEILEKSRNKQDDISKDGATSTASTAARKRRVFSFWNRGNDNDDLSKANATIVSMGRQHSRETFGRMSCPGNFEAVAETPIKKGLFSFIAGKRNDDGKGKDDTNEVSQVLPLRYGVGANGERLEAMIRSSRAA